MDEAGFKEDAHVDLVQFIFSLNVLETNDTKANRTGVKGGEFLVILHGLVIEATETEAINQVDRVEGRDDQERAQAEDDPSNSSSTGVEKLDVLVNDLGHNDPSVESSEEAAAEEGVGGGQMMVPNPLSCPVYKKGKQTNDGHGGEQVEEGTVHQHKDNTVAQCLLQHDDQVKGVEGILK